MAWTLWRSKEPSQPDTAARGAVKSPARQGAAKVQLEDRQVMNLPMLKGALDHMPLPDEAKLLRLLVAVLVDDAFSHMANDQLAAELLEEQPNSKLPLGSIHNPLTREGRGKVLVDRLPDGKTLVMDFAKLKEAMGLRVSDEATSLVKVLVLAMVDEAFNEFARNPTDQPDEQAR
jgi:hypothetical protein